MNDNLRKLQEKWDKELEDENKDKTEEQSLEDAFWGMETLVYSSRSVPFQKGNNVTVTEIESSKEKKED